MFTNTAETLCVVCLRRTILLFFAWLYLGEVASAQVTADPTANTQVNFANGQFTIQGGTAAEHNLFHSFSEFSVPTHGVASFLNDPSVINIFSRVTGGTVSNIDGLIQAHGSANFFLLNPNGLFFGPNAQLNIGGSFLGSTANSIEFNDGSQFRTLDPNLATELMTMRGAPISLRFGADPGSIGLQGPGHQVTFDENGLFVVDSRPDGLQVNEGQTLSLVGGPIALNGANLTARSGQINLGSVTGNVTVGLQQNGSSWSLDFSDINHFGDVSLSQESSLDVSSQLTINVLPQIIELLSNNENAQNQPMIDALFDSIAQTSALSSGDVQIQANNINLTDSSVILALGGGNQPGGLVSLTASDSMFLAAPEFPFTIVPGLTVAGIYTDNFGSNTGGNIDITAKDLSATGVLILSVATSSEGQGGTLQLDISDSIVLNISNIEALAFDEGDAGSIIIDTQRLTLLQGAQIDVGTRAGGNAANLTIHASESIDIIGQNGDDLSAIVADNPSPSTGNAGNITIVTNRLTLQDEGTISVGASPSITGEITDNDLGEGNAGSLTIQAKSIILDNAASITAAVLEGDQGNILIDSDLLVVGNNSEITTSALGNATGGNIFINTGFLILFNSSFITANAVTNAGGNIEINAQGIFITPDSAITASSELGIDGIVEINRLEIDPIQSVIDISQNVGNPELRQGCQSVMGNQARGRFVDLGRGGEGLTSVAFLGGGDIWEDDVLPKTLTHNPPNHPSENTTINHSNQPLPLRPDSSESIIEAQGWMIDPSGKVKLVETHQASRPKRLCALDRDEADVSQLDSR